MESMADVTIAAATEMPRFGDWFINLQEVLRQLAESVMIEIMSAEKREVQAPAEQEQETQEAAD